MKKAPLRPERRRLSIGGCLPAAAFAWPPLLDAVGPVDHGGLLADDAGIAGGGAHTGVSARQHAAALAGEILLRLQVGLDLLLLERHEFGRILQLLLGGRDDDAV